MDNCFFLAFKNLGASYNGENMVNYVSKSRRTKIDKANDFLSCENTIQ